jgi:molybdopterin-guanine dinucleotide biosynthesis protein A
VAVLAVDMPWIDAGWFEWLLGHRTLSRGLIAQHPDAFEPLAAVYPTAALPAIKERLERGDYALQPLIRSLIAQGHLTAVPLPPERRAAALSVNLPTQLG